jgi:hypothetical protein
MKLPKNDRGYASFGMITDAPDPYIMRMDTAFANGVALAEEGRKLNLKHVRSDERLCFKQGFMSVA